MTMEPVPQPEQVTTDISTAAEAESIFQRAAAAGTHEDTIYAPLDEPSIDLGVEEESAFGRSVHDPGFEPTT